MTYICVNIYGFKVLDAMFNHLIKIENIIENVKRFDDYVTWFGFNENSLRTVFSGGTLIKECSRHSKLS
jgi:hypothetical protein